MISIRDLVQQVLATGYLTIAAEEQLRSLLTAKYTKEDFTAFMQLQQAAMNGWVKQEARELFHLRQSSASNSSYLLSTESVSPGGVASKLRG
jgi:hypothetical protein